MPPTLRPDARGAVYVIRRPRWNQVVVTRERWESDSETLLERRRLRRVDWAEAARRILTDALEEPPVRKLALDYGRFLFTRSGQTRTVSGAEIEKWLGSWELPTLPGEKARVRDG